MTTVEERLLPSADPVQLVESLVPELAIALDPRHFCVKAPLTQCAGPHASNFLRGDEPRVLQDADMLLHAGQGHVELGGEVGD